MSMSEKVKRLLRLEAALMECESFSDISSQVSQLWLALDREFDKHPELEPFGAFLVAQEFAVKTFYDECRKRLFSEEVNTDSHCPKCGSLYAIHNGDGSCCG